MKNLNASIAGCVLLAAVSAAQPITHYNVVELGPVSGTFSQGFFVSNSRLVAGLSTVHDGTQHATLWGMGLKMDIGFGKLNSGAFGFNASGQVPLQSESAVKDPNNENFCAYGTGLQCRPFLWQGGVVTSLPLLGGNNGTVGIVNSKGEIAGIAETGTRDPACPAGVQAGGNGPQVLGYQGVVWGPAPGQIRQLAPLPGDSVSMAIWINDSGQAVGASGTCANSALPPVAYGAHATLWDKDGTVHDLGNLGGAIGNMALAINNQGQVVGTSATSPKSEPTVGIDAFLWNKQTGMRDLGTLPGDGTAKADIASVGLGLNDSGSVVVGASFDADGNPRAFVWQNGTMVDLNTLVPDSSPLYLLFAEGINASGEIAGFGLVKSTCMADPSLCEIHGFLAVPNYSPSGRVGGLKENVSEASAAGRFSIPENVRAAIRQRLPFAHLGTRPISH